MMMPRTLVNISIALPASLLKKSTMAQSALMTAAGANGIPQMTLRPIAAPPTFPMLNTRPPIATRIAMKYPSPGNTSLATSCARFPETPRMRQMLSCTIMSMTMETMMAKAKAAFSWSVKTVVCVRNPGPIAEVAIRKAAPISTLTADSFFSFIFLTSCKYRIKPSSLYMQKSCRRNEISTR